MIELHAQSHSYWQSLVIAVWISIPSPTLMFVFYLRLPHTYIIYRDGYVIYRDGYVIYRDGYVIYRDGYVRVICSHHKDSKEN